MNILLLFFSLLLFSVTGVSTHSEDDSWQCRENLDFQRVDAVRDLEGLWFEVERSYFPFEIGQKCNTFNFSEMVTGTDDFQVQLLKMSGYTSRGKLTSRLATVVQEKEADYLIFDLHDLPTYSQYDSLRVYVLEFERESHVVLYMCKKMIQVGLESYVGTKRHFWILSRQPEMDAQLQERLRQMVRENTRLWSNQMTRVDQASDKCPHTII